MAASTARLAAWEPGHFYTATWEEQSGCNGRDYARSKEGISMRLSLGDLPPKYQEMVLAQLKAQKKVKEAKRESQKFDSRGEADFYLSTVLPGLQSGRLRKADLHRRFELMPEGEYQGKKLPSIRYTPDFFLEWADGTVEVVEIKSRFVRRCQRDYPLRRRLFLEKYAMPNGWTWREIITDGGKNEKSKKT